MLTPISVLNYGACREGGSGPYMDIRYTITLPFWAPDGSGRVRTLSTFSWISCKPGHPGGLIPGCHTGFGYIAPIIDQAECQADQVLDQGPTVHWNALYYYGLKQGKFGSSLFLFNSNLPKGYTQ